jgi:hypothetical protein
MARVTPEFSDVSEDRQAYLQKMTLQGAQQSPSDANRDLEYLRADVGMGDGVLFLDPTVVNSVYASEKEMADILGEAAPS